MKTISSGSAVHEGAYSYTLNTTDFAEGVYILKLATDRNVSIARFAVQR